MKDIARGQVNAMYQIGAKQAEASMINAAEIVSHIDGRAGEIVTSLNNMNKSIIGIGEKIDALGKLLQTQTQIEEEQMKAQNQSAIDSNGRVTLGSWFNQMKSNVKDAATNNIVAQMLAMGKDQLTPAAIISMLLSDTKEKKTGRVGAAVGSGIDFLTELIGGKQTNFSEKFANNSLNTIGNSFNDIIGNTISNILLGGNKKLNDALGKIPLIGDMLSGALNKGLTLKSSTVGDYKAEIKNEYTRDKAVFDGIARQSITEIIPGYLKIIAQSMTGVAWDHKNGHVTQHGSSRKSQDKILDAVNNSNINAMKNSDHDAAINKDAADRASKINIDDSELKDRWNKKQDELEAEATKNGETYQRAVFDKDAEKQMRSEIQNERTQQIVAEIKMNTTDFESAFKLAVLIVYKGDGIEVQSVDEFKKTFSWSAVKKKCLNIMKKSLEGANGAKKRENFNSWFNSLQIAIMNPSLGKNLFDDTSTIPGQFMSDVFNSLKAANEADMKRKNDDASMGRLSEDLTEDDAIRYFEEGQAVRTAQTNNEQRRAKEREKYMQTEEYKERLEKFNKANESKFTRGTAEDPEKWLEEMVTKSMKKMKEYVEDEKTIEQSQREKAGIVREEIDATKISKTETVGISADFEKGLFGKLDSIISAINHLNVKNTTGGGDIPSILNNIYGRGDDNKGKEETSKEDEIISDTATKMAQTQAADGDLASDLPFLKRITSQMKNKGLGTKLSQMFTMWGTNMKNSVKDKVKGALNKTPLGSTISKYILPAIGVIGAWIKKKIGAAFKLIGRKVLTPALNLVKKGMKSGMDDVKKGWTQIWGTQEEREKRKEEREKRAEAKKAQRDEKRAKKRADKEAKALAKAAEKGTREGSEKGSKEGTEKGVKEGERGGSGNNQPGFFKRVSNKLFGNKNNAGSADSTTTSDPTVGGSQDGGGKKGGFLGKIFNTLGGMAKILAGIGKMVLTAVASLTAVKVIMDLVQKTLTTAVKPLNKAFKKLTGTIKKLLKAAGASIKYVANLVVKLVDSLMPVLNVLVDLVGDVLGKVISALDPILAVATSIVNVLVDVLNPILDAVIDVVNPILTTVGDLLTTIADGLMGVVMPVMSAVSTLVDALLPIINPILTLATSLIDWFATEGPLKWALDIIVPTLQTVAKGIEWLANIIDLGVAKLKKSFADVLFDLGTIIYIMSPDDDNSLQQTAGKLGAEATADIAEAMKKLRGDDVKEDNKKSSTPSDNVDHSDAIPTPIPSTGGSLDSISGSGDFDGDETINGNTAELLAPFLEAIATELHGIREVQEGTVTEGMENTESYQDIMLKDVTKHINKQMMMASKVFIPMYASFKTDVVPTLESIESLTKLSIGNDQAYYGQQLAAQALQLVAAGSAAAGAALFQTSIGLSASGMAYQAEGATSKANQVSYLTTGLPFYISSLYPDAATTTDGTTPTSEIATDNAEVTDGTSTDNNPQTSEIAPTTSTDPTGTTNPTNNNTPTNNTNNTSNTNTNNTTTGTNTTNTTNTTTAIPTIPDTTSSERGFRAYFGSGDSQGRYGSYLNMSQRGCGPVALADAANRRGGNINAGALASSMASSGNYSSSRGTSVGGFIDTAASMGMGYQVGGVTSQSLNRATPNNPVTLVGSGAGFGTRSGNTHYINVVGTDHAGGAYVSNPLSGRVERRSANELASSSVVGLYGSGDVRGANAAWYHLYGAGPSGYYAFNKTNAKHFYDQLTSNEKTAIDNMWSQSDPVSWNGDKWSWLAAQLNNAKITASNVNQVLPAIKNWLTQKRAEYVLNTLNKNKYGQVDDPREEDAAKTAALNSIYSHNKVTISAATAKAQLTSARRKVLEPLYQQYLALYMKQHPGSNPPSIEEFFANSASEALEDLYKDYLQDYMRKNPSAQPPTFDTWYSNSKNWSWSKIFNKVKDTNPLLKELQSSSSGSSSSDAEIADASYGTSSGLGTTNGGMGSIVEQPGGNTGYISTEQKLSADSNPSVIPTIEGDSFSERIKNAMSGLTGIFSNILKIFSANEDSEVDEAVKEGEEKRVEKVIREAVGNEEYERYASQAYELLRQNNPKAATETDEHYEARIKSMWEDEHIKRRYLNAVAKNNANILNAMKVNGMVDASEGSMSSIYGEYDAATGTWSGGMLNAALGQGGTGSIVESSYNDPYAGKFVSDGGAVMWTDGYQPTIFDTDITEDGGATLSKSPVHEFFWQTSGANDTTGATQYAFTQNGGWYTRRSTPDKTGTGSTDESHQGVDILTYPASVMQAGKAELHAITGGKVIDVRYDNEGNANSPYNQTGDGGWGNSVQFEDAAGYFHRYAHMRDKPTVNVGDTINPGQLLGVIGTTGKSTGEHVHYQINPPGHGNEDGTYVNPLTYFKYHQPAASTGAVQGEIPWEGAIQDTKAVNYWPLYQTLYRSDEGIKYEEEWPKIFKEAADASLTPAETAMTISTAIHEDGAKKLVGSKSRTATTYDGVGQQATGIFNWASSDAKDPTLLGQFKYVKKRYFSGTPYDCGGTLNGTLHGGESTYNANNKVFKDTTSRANGYTLKPGDLYVDKLNTDFVEGASAFYHWDLAGDAKDVPHLAKYVGTGIGIYNWMLRNGYAVAPSSYQTNAANNAAQNATDPSQIGTGQGGPSDYDTYSDKNNNMGIIWNYLRNNLGYSEEASAGVMGNLEAESGYYPMATLHHSKDDFTKKLVESVDRTHTWEGADGPFGIAQWLGGRRDNLLKKSMSDNKSIVNLPMQLEFIKQELESSESKTHNQMKSIGGVQNAADYWRLHFERCGEQLMQRRRTSAQEAYDKFKGTNGGAVNVNGGQFGATAVATRPEDTLWINTLHRAIKATDDAGLHSYVYGGNTTVELDGKTIHGRPDCTGLIQWPLSYLGYDLGNIQSHALVEASSSNKNPIKKDGENSPNFEALKWGSEVNADTVVPGDIVVRNGHGEIAYGKVGDSFKVWNYGSDDSIRATQKVASQVLSGTSLADAASNLPGAERNGSNSAYAYAIRPTGELSVGVNGATGATGTAGTGGTGLGISGYQVGKHPTAVNWAAKTYGYTGISRNSGQGKGFSSYAFGSIGGIANFVDVSKYANLSTGAQGATAAAGGGGNLAVGQFVDALTKTQIAADEAGSHSYSHSGPKLNVDGKEVTGRLDCSGMVMYAADLMGYDNGNIQSDTLVKASTKTKHPIKKDGTESEDWTAYKWQDEIKGEDLKMGDIVVRNQQAQPFGDTGYGHVEVVAGLQDGHIWGWNYGGDKAIVATQKAAHEISAGKDPLQAIIDNDNNGSNQFDGSGGINQSNLYNYVIRPTQSLMTTNSFATNGVGNAAGTFTDSSLAKPMFMTPLSKDVNGNPTEDIFYGERGRPITKMTWHTWASDGDLDDCIGWWKSGQGKQTDGQKKEEAAGGKHKTGVSANYIIDTAGNIGQPAHESIATHTTSNEDNDRSAITVEIANSKGASGPSWPITDASLNAAKRLTVDVAKRNNIKSFNYTAKNDGYNGDGKDGTWTYHRMFSLNGKSCPGDYIVNKTDSILADINRQISGSGDEIPIPPIDQSKIMQTVGTNDLSNLMIDTNELPPASTTNVIVTKSSKAEDEMIDRMMNHTYNVRAEQVEILLQQILDKMDNLSSKQPTTTPKQKPQNAFPDNNIPKQIQRLAKGV